jgi:hypothetical protein
MLLLLTAWGNALAMAVISGIASVVALAVLARRAPGWRVFGLRFLGMFVAFAVAAVLAFGIASSRN